MRDASVQHIDHCVDSIEAKLQPPGARGAAGTCRLYAATLGYAEDGGVVTVLHLCRVSSRREVVARLSARIGAAWASAADVTVGIDPLYPIVVELLGAKLARHLADYDDLPGGALLGGGDLHVLQRRG